MANSADFVRHVGELFAPLGQVATNRMFSGHGVYLDGLFIAIIAGDELYLKTDGVTQAAFDAESCAPLTFSKGGKTMITSYRRAPDEALDAPHLMQPWARLAVEAALRAAARKKPAAKKNPIAKPAAKTKPAAKKKSPRPVRKKKSQ